jgi:mono/diheme cytochrome c family protein
MKAEQDRRGRFAASRRTAARLAVCLLVASALALIIRAPWISPAALGPEFADADSPELVALGGTLYRQHCASCHGVHLEGQPNWENVAANGRLPAPPQDHRGHSWMHSDVELLRTMSVSLRDTAPPGYATDMPAFQGTLSDRQMIAVLAFIKNRWPTGVRVYQSMLNPGRQGMPSVAAESDWSFPIDCGQEPTRASPAAK